MQDLERARLLCELVRKREKLKAAYIRTVEQSVMMQLNPLEAAMSRLLDQLFAKDTQEIFTEPVDIEEVPDYNEVVTNPMDLGTMRNKLREGQYQSLDDMENDFQLMIQNCLAYNNKDTIFYRAGVRMRDQCSPLFKSVRKELIRSGIVEEPQSDESLAHEIDAELIVLLDKKLPHEELLTKLQALMEKTMKIKHGMIRGKRTKQIKAEITKTKKLANKSVNKSENSPVKSEAKNATAISIAADMTQSDEEEEGNKEEAANAQLTTPPCSPMKNISNSASPSGVNRRTAVLFTRKAQAAAKVENNHSNSERVGLGLEFATFDNQRRNSTLKKPENPLSEDAANESPALSTFSPLVMSPKNFSTNDSNKSKSPKKISRSRRNNSLTSEAGSSSISLPISSFLEPKNLSPNALNSIAAVASTSTGSGHRKLSPFKERYVPSSTMPDSFRTYRGRGIVQSSDSDDSRMSCTHSACSSCSGSGSDFG